MRWFVISMPILEAAIRGKKNDEDILTSQVFGTLDAANRPTVLGSFLNGLGIDVPVDQLENATFRYWEKFGTRDQREPDVILQTKSRLIFVESKLDSQLMTDQLVEEFTDLKKHAKKQVGLNLICVTKHRKEPAEVQDARIQVNAQEGQIKWTSWWEIREKFTEILRSRELDNVSKRLIGDLLNLLEARGFVRFTGLKKRELIQIIESQRVFKRFYKDIPLLVGELSILLEDFNIESRRSGGSFFWKDGKGTRLDNPEQWLHTFCTFAFADKSWDIGDLRHAESTYLFIRFYLNRTEEPIWVGYSIGPYRLDKGKWVEVELTDDQKKQMCEFFKKPENSDMSVASVGNWNHSNVHYVERASLIDTAYLEHKRNRRFEIFNRIELKDIDKATLVSMLAKRLTRFRDMVNTLSLLPKERPSAVEEVEAPEEEEEKET